uniref:Uncharacterized protein n=1 Tax=Heterorhabditis bacteriophora TaxID=37862 RepID=A0A1I7W8S2_HETBA
MIKIIVLTTFSLQTLDLGTYDYFPSNIKKLKKPKAKMYEAGLVLVAPNNEVVNVIKLLLISYFLLYKYFRFDQSVYYIILLFDIFKFIQHFSVREKVKITNTANEQQRRKGDINQGTSTGVIGTPLREATVRAVIDGPGSVCTDRDEKEDFEALLSNNFYFKSSSWLL